MIAKIVKFKDHRCFKNQFSGFDEIKLINVIIGKNNTGKSHLIEYVNRLCDNRLGSKEMVFECVAELDEKTLRRKFSETTTGGELKGQHWLDHGALFVGENVKYIISGSSQIDLNFVNYDIIFKVRGHLSGKATDEVVEARKDVIYKILNSTSSLLFGKNFRKISAERDIKSAISSVNLALNEDGDGATNIIRRFILSASPGISRDVIQKDLLKSLNEIFGRDGCFTEIQVKEYDDDKNSKSALGHYEVFLGQEKKGLIPLSRSGSSLKTVILVLLNLIVIPVIDKKEGGEYVFAFEELENNLHPSLLRRLLQYIERFAIQNKAHFFLTTHASVALDFFGMSPNAQIVHVFHDGISAQTKTVGTHFDKLGIISELGAKPSDLLQANGIIWVEGPSDCIYINKWLSLYSNGELIEGRDYQCAFYGGSLLARTQFVPPEQAENELVNLFQINPNVIIVCDSDKTSADSSLKDRVMRIKDEVSRIPNAHLWVTDAKEIENYIPCEALSKGLTSLYPKKSPEEEVKVNSSPTQFESFFPNSDKSNDCFWTRVTGRKSFDKNDLAAVVAPHMNLELMSSRFDLETQISLIVGKIRSWGGV